MSYIIISKKINKTKFGKLLPTNVPITLLKLKDFFNTTKKTEKEMIDILQQDKDIEFKIIEEKKQKENKEENKIKKEDKE
mgnify:CR=1 FL=1